MVNRMEQDQMSLLEWRNVTAIDPKMRQDKIQLLDEMEFSNYSVYFMAKESIEIQEDISKKLVTLFEDFLSFFSIEADIEIHNG